MCTCACVCVCAPFSGKTWLPPEGVLRANGVDTKWADMAKSEVLLGQASSRVQREPHTAVSSGGRSAGLEDCSRQETDTRW